MRGGKSVWTLWTRGTLLNFGMHKNVKVCNFAKGRKKITQHKINVRFLLCKQDRNQLGCPKQFFACKAKV